MLEIDTFRAASKSTSSHTTNVTSIAGQDISPSSVHDFTPFKPHPSRAKPRRSLFGMTRRQDDDFAEFCLKRGIESPALTSLFDPQKINGLRCDDKIADIDFDVLMQQGQFAPKEKVSAPVVPLSSQLSRRHTPEISNLRVDHSPPTRKEPPKKDEVTTNVDTPAEPESQTDEFLPKLSSPDTLKKFLTRPVKKGRIIQCVVMRDKSSSVKTKLYPEYRVYLDDEEDSETFLMAAKKRPQNKTSNYLITCDKDDLSKDSPYYVGKVRSNFLGTEFTCFDNGRNLELDDHNANLSLPLRRQLAVVCYRPNVLGSRGPRQMRVLVPAVKSRTSIFTCQPTPDNPKGLSEYIKESSSTVKEYVNTTPQWNQSIGAYVLNFNGRVTKASVKNFQLSDSSDASNILLQFGKTGKDSFTMDFSYPLSPLQAFGICLSGFDKKIACE